MAFGTWTLRTQLLIVFSIATLLMIGVVMGVTVAQLLWVRSEIVNSTEEHVEDYFLDRLKILLEEDSQYVTKVLHKHFHAAELVANLFEQVVREVPVEPGEIHYSSDEGIVENFQHGVFFSKNEEISDEGMAVIEKVVALDQIFPHLRSEAYSSFGAGFNYDDLYYGYPANAFTSDTFTPYTREWFYKANNTAGITQMTDPFLGLSSGEWLVSFSRTFMDGDFVLGVGSIDVGLDEIENLFAGLEFGDSGFELLVSYNGILVGSPNGITGDTVPRIDSSDLYGISTEQWENEIRDNPVDGEAMEFTDPNGDVYVFVKKSLYLIEGQEQLSHVLMACMKKSEIFTKRDDVEEDLSDVYNLVFWLVVAIAILFFVIIIAILCWYTHQAARSMQRVRKFIETINEGSHVKKMGFDAESEELYPVYETMRGLYKACLEKRESIYSLEQHFGSFNWRGIRPTNWTLYNEWRRIVYPSNRFSGDTPDWNGALEILKKIS